MTCGALLLATLTGTASAQILVGTSDLTTGEHYHVDVGTGVTTPMLDTWLPAGPEHPNRNDIVGMAADDGNCTLFLSQSRDPGCVILSWTYGDANGPQELIVDPIDLATGAPIRCEALAFANGILYGVEQFGVSGAARGIYSLDIWTGTAQLAFPFQDPSLNISGLAYDSASGLFYGSNDNPLVGFGVLTFDIAQQVEAFVCPYPAGVTDVDGVAVDPAGVVYLVLDEPGPLHAYDLSTQTWNSDLAGPVVADWVFSAATWAPSYLPGTRYSGCPGPLGISYCADQPANSTLAVGWIKASGSPRVQDNLVELTAGNLPPGQFGFFLTSLAPNLVSMPGGSQGDLCLASPIGRYTGHSTFQADSFGQASLAIDLSQMPTPSGTIPVLVGETRFFQAWHRDLNPGPTSNFTGGVEIIFE